MRLKKINGKVRLDKKEPIFFPPPRITVGTGVIVPLILPNKVKDKPVGFASCIVDENNKATLMYFWVEPKYRKNGLGTKIIAACQEMFDEIKTSVTGPSENILKSLGFEWEDETWIVWKRKETGFQYRCKNCGTKREGLLDKDDYDWVCPNCKGRRIDVREV